MSPSLVTSAFGTRMTLMCWVLPTLKSSNTIEKLPSATCTRATMPEASASTRWNVPVATVTGPDAVGCGVVLTAIDALAEGDELDPVLPAQPARAAVARIASPIPVTRRYMLDLPLGFWRGDDGSRR